MRKFAFGRFFLFLILGLVLGTAFGIFLGKVFPVFDYGISFGIPTLNINLIFMNVSFGFDIKFNIGSIIGILIFMLLFAIT